MGDVDAMIDIFSKKPFKDAISKHLDYSTAREL